MNWVVAVLGAGVGSGLMTILLAVIQRHWKKEDDQIDIKQINQKLDQVTNTQNVLARAMKVSLAHDINYLGTCYIYAKEITIDEKRGITEMHNVYEEVVKLDPNGENGLCTVMDEVNKIKVVNEHTPKNTTPTAPKKKTGAKK